MSSGGAFHHIDANVTTIEVGDSPSSAGDGELWESFKFLFHGFKDLSTTSTRIQSPEFTFDGHRWCMVVCPGGDNRTRPGCTLIYLKLCSGDAAKVSFQYVMLDKLGKANASRIVDNIFDSSHRWGHGLQFPRSFILDQSSNVLDDNGTLAIVVRMKSEPKKLQPFVPKNPCLTLMKKKFLDEETSDASFELSNMEVKEDGSKRAKSSVTFPAHRSILQICAPMLAALFGSGEDGEVTTAAINDIKPDIFRHLLWYVYGGSVPEGELNTHAKDIIDAADKYSIVNLKLEAEAAYVNSTTITMENVMDNLLYADAKNCALLKEVVMDFLAENSKEAIQKISFTDFPGHIVKDLLVATTRSKEDKNKPVDDFDIMRVDELRRKLYEKGLEVDGSREAMIDALKAYAARGENNAADAEG
jgi:hypothetical protein